MSPGKNKYIKRLYETCEKSLPDIHSRIPQEGSFSPKRPRGFTQILKKNKEHSASIGSISSLVSLEKLE